MPFSKKSHDGELYVDHRASPGISDEKARLMGFAPGQMKGVFECATLGCPHCGSCVVMNPLRTRERAHCYQCNRYICDWCDAARHEPDYVHRTMREIADMVASGKWTMSGTMSRPILTPTGG